MRLELEFVPEFLPITIIVANHRLKISPIFFCSGMYKVELECSALFGDRHGSRSREGKMTTRTEKVLLALVIATLAGVAASASETINYSYDALGRLVQVRRTGTVNNNVTANYQYDKAGNRTNVNVSSPNPPP
jgi:YD repeat-containing protein